MGLFDFLKKIDKEAINQIGKDVMEGIQNAAEGVKNYHQETPSNNTETTNHISTKYEGFPIPSEYNGFPQFEKSADRVVCKNESNYHRCTMQYDNVSPQEIAEYVAKIESLGYRKGSKVRYDKDNTYIIVDEQNASCDLELVFHIKM